jgi:hypothetical protein
MSVQECLWLAVFVCSCISCGCSLLTFFSRR